MAFKPPHTKVIATLGDPRPDTKEPEAKPFGTYGQGIYDLERRLVTDLTLDKLVEDFVVQGVDLFRINLAHVDPEHVRTRFLEVKAAILAAEERHAGTLRGRRIGVLADLPGPKIRFDGQPRLPSKRLFIHFDSRESPYTGRWADQEPSEEASALILLGTTAFAQAAPEAIDTILKAVRSQLERPDPQRPLLAFVGDGDCTLEVRAVHGQVLECWVVEDRTRGKPLSEHKGFTVRGIDKPVAALTEEDKIKLTALLAADYEGYPDTERMLSHVGISFCQNREDVRRFLTHVMDQIRPNFPRADAGELLAQAPHLVAKIETAQGAAAAAEILDFADGIMIARGDLALEMETVDLPKVAKNLTSQCNLRGKFVIMATQMLESMRTNIECTRPEATDVFSAVVDGVDALMLSGETSTGKYPLHAIEKMKALATKAEEFLAERSPADDRIDAYFTELLAIRGRVRGWEDHWRTVAGDYNQMAQELIIEDRDATFIQQVAAVKGTRLRAQEFTDRISHAACSMAAEDLGAGRGAARSVAAIVAPTASGRTARMLARFRPPVPILALPHNRLTARKLAIHWGVVTAGLLPIYRGMNVSLLMSESQNRLAALQLQNKVVIFICGTPLGKVGTTNLVFRGRVGEDWV